MTEPNISPLARRLAEENNVEWRSLHGSGAEGKVVERDVLDYLARVMAGEEAVDPTPEPVPDGMEAWPDGDVALAGADMKASSHNLEDLQRDLAASSRPASGAPNGVAQVEEPEPVTAEVDRDDSISEDIFLFDDDDEVSEADPFQEDDLLLVDDDEVEVVEADAFDSGGGDFDVDFDVDSDGEYHAEDGGPDVFGEDFFVDDEGSDDEIDDDEEIDMELPSPSAEESVALGGSLIAPEDADIDPVLSGEFEIPDYDEREAPELFLASQPLNESFEDEDDTEELNAMLASDPPELDFDDASAADDGEAAPLAMESDDALSGDASDDVDADDGEFLELDAEDADVFAESEPEADDGDDTDAALLEPEIAAAEAPSEGVSDEPDLEVFDDASDDVLAADADAPDPDTDLDADPYLHDDAEEDEPEPVFAADDTAGELDEVPLEPVAATDATGASELAAAPVSALLSDEPAEADDAVESYPELPLVSYGNLLRRRHDLSALAEAQLAVARELGEEDPIAPSAFLLRAAAKALAAEPLAAGSSVAVAVTDGGFGVRSVPDALRRPFVDLLGLTRDPEGLQSRVEGVALVVADLSALEVDEAVLDVGAPVLTLGRILYDNQRGSYRSTLSLSGPVAPDVGARLLARVAELLDAPIRLVI